MKLTLIFSAISLMLFTACDSGTTEPSTSIPSGCVITVEKNEIIKKLGLKPRAEARL